MSSIEVTDFRVPDIRLSDHRPLICDFTVRRSDPHHEHSAWTYASGADGIGVLTLDVPERSANTLSSAVLRRAGGRADGHRSARRRAGLIIRSGKKSGFIAGADINEFTHARLRGRGAGA